MKKALLASALAVLTIVPVLSKADTAIEKQKETCIAAKESFTDLKQKIEPHEAQKMSDSNVDLIWKGDQCIVHFDFVYPLENTNNMPAKEYAKTIFAIKETYLQTSKEVLEGKYAQLSVYNRLMKVLNKPDSGVKVRMLGVTVNVVDAKKYQIDNSTTYKFFNI